MPVCDIKDKNNQSVGQLTLPDEVFGQKARPGVVHDAVVNFLANQRQGTHSTKTRGMVSGGGKKPWKQKHTGRARAGSSRSPLWRGGAIIFGPQPRDYSYELPKKARKLALRAALSGKLADGEVTVINELSMEKPRTKDMTAILKTLDLAGKSTLIVIPDYNKTVVLSARNIPDVTIRRVSDLNSYDIVSHRMVLMTRQAAEMLAEAGAK
ncbi:MAG: 50S ribosomal protein L4 [Nitrospiraceae bacterium]|nr:50S ribosomal protein L4 [Nitrospiraceae bacterium]